MKTLEKIKWRFFRPDKNCPCIACNKNQSEFRAHIGDFTLPVCLECSELPETALMKSIKGGKNG